MEKISQERLELALRASNEGIWDWVIDEKGHDELFYSEKTREVLGFTGIDPPHLFKDLDKLIHEDDLAFFSATFQNVEKKGGNDNFAVDCRFIKADSDVVWLRVRGVAVRNESGELKRFAGSVIEITQRKRAEAALQEERHQLMTLIENIPVNVYFKDLDSKFVTANTATANKLGSDNVEDMIGKSDHDYFDARHADKSKKDEERIIKTGEAKRETMEQEIWEEKEDSWVITSKVPWLDRKGVIRGTFGVSSDVTSLVKTQRQLMEMTHQLKAQSSEIEEELRLAYEIQQSMIQEDQITQFPENPTEGQWQVNFAYSYVPVSGLAGDLYQVIPLEDNRMGVFMCDVMGHGVRSALIVSMIRGIMEKERAAASIPESFLYGLNQSLVSILRRAGVTMFGTAFYAVLDFNAQSLVYANAGHPSPIIVANDGVKRLSEYKKVLGPALGLVENFEYSSAEISLENFKKLIIFTDGIYETTNPQGEEIGVKPLMQSLEKETKIEDDLANILEMTKSFAEGADFGDDVCMLGMKLTKK